MPLDDAFIDWWFAPWRAAAAPLLPGPPLAGMDGELARRDGYRLWCERLGVAPDLPAAMDPAWAEVGGADPATLAGAARLFGGLLAARAHDAAGLAALSAAERGWCLRTAATQPLPSGGRDLYAATDPPALRGLCELASHLRAGFPGLWPRLRIGLDAGSAARIDELLAAMPEPDAGGAGAARVRRCWLLCRARAAATADPKSASPAPAQPIIDSR
jgi:hypothetical protein